MVSTALFTNTENYGISHAYSLSGNGTFPNVWEYTAQTEYCRTQKDNSCNIVTQDLIVFGYIDGADDDGLLILRNSWGSDSGDGGNYYMSYDYARQMLLEVTALHVEE